MGIKTFSGHLIQINCNREIPFNYNLSGRNRKGSNQNGCFAHWKLKMNQNSDDAIMEVLLFDYREREFLWGRIPNSMREMIEELLFIFL